MEYVFPGAGFLLDRSTMTESSRCSAGSIPRRVRGDGDQPRRGQEDRRAARGPCLGRVDAGRGVDVLLSVTGYQIQYILRFTARDQIRGKDEFLSRPWTSCSAIPTNGRRSGSSTAGRRTGRSLSTRSGISASRWGIATFSLAVVLPEDIPSACRRLRRSRKG